MLTTNVGLATQWPMEVALSGARMNEIENDTSGNARGGGGQSVGQALIQSKASESLTDLGHNASSDPL